MITKDYKRAWIISDTHFGVRSNSQEWIGIITDYFNNFFIPMVKKNWKPGDVIIHCGDIFDNRTSIELLVLNRAIEIFGELTKIGDVIMITGNHDIYRRNATDVNSLKPLALLPNITVFENDEVIQCGNKKLLFMPWKGTHEEEKASIAKHPDAHYLFCHTDIAGMKFNKWVTVEHGNDHSTYSQFDRVFCGHIHYGQTFKNIVLVGSPYQLTRSDIGNEKGIYLLDIENNSYNFIKNSYSPQFHKFQWEGILNKTVSEFKEMVRNNFVDIIVHSKWINNPGLQKIFENVDGYRRLEYSVVSDDVLIDNYEELTEGRFDLQELCMKYIDGLKDTDETTKDQLKKAITKLYQSTINEN